MARLEKMHMIVVTFIFPLSFSLTEYTDEAQIHSVNMQECLKLILERGGDVTCCDANGMTPLHWALQFPSQYTN